MPRFALFILSALLASPALAAPLIELDRAAAATAGNEARFVQSFTPKGFKNSQVESGTVLFGTLPMMRWTYAKPEEKTFVFNGTDSWLYIPGDRQVTVAHLDDARRRDLPFLVLGDQVARDRSFKVAETRRGASFLTTLQPRDAAAAIRNVVISSSASTHQISRIEYTDRDGNHTTFDLSGYHPQRATADAFRFVSPAGVKVITQ